MLFRVCICALALAWSGPPEDDAPVLQRPGQAKPPEPEPAPAPKPEPSPTPKAEPKPEPAPPAVQNPESRRPSAVVPLGRPEPAPAPAPEPAPAPAPAARPAARVAPEKPPPPPAPPPAQVDAPLERPKGPGTAMIASGAVMGGVGIGLTAAALASDRFAPEPWQRAIVVPISLGILSAGAALFIIGVDRHVKTKRWQERAALTPGGLALRF